MTDSDSAGRPPWWHEGGQEEPNLNDVTDAASEVLGSAAQEAVKLVGALQQRLADNGVPGTGAEPIDLGSGVSGMLSMLGQAATSFGSAMQAPTTPPPNSEQSTDSEEQPDSVGSAVPHEESAGEYVAPGQAAACSSCPVCQVIAAVRSVQPETVERMVNAVLDLADAVQEARPNMGQSVHSAPDSRGDSLDIEVEVDPEAGLDSAEGDASSESDRSGNPTEPGTGTDADVPDGRDS